MAHALARSFASVNVVVSSDRADGTSSAANAPWQARGYQHGEVDRGAANSRHHGEAGQADQERDLPAQQVGQPSAEQQQAAEPQRVGGDHPLPVRGGEVERVLCGRQRDVHHRDVEDHHQLRQADHAQDEPAPVPGAVHGGGIGHETHDLSQEFVTGVPAIRVSGFQVAEHERELFRSADWVIELGPRAGADGGTVIAQGTPGQLETDPRSVMGPFLAGATPVPPRPARGGPGGRIAIEISHLYNLHDLTATFPCTS